MRLYGCHINPVNSDFLRRELCQKGARRQNAHSLKLLEGEQVFISSDNNIRPECNREGENMIVIWIAADPNDIRKRAGENPPNVF